MIRPFLAIQILKNGDEECKRFAATGLCGAQNIPALERMGDRTRLDICKRFVMRSSQSGGRGFREREIREGLERFLDVEFFDSLHKRRQLFLPALALQRFVLLLWLLELPGSHDGNSAVLFSMSSVLEKKR